MNSGFGTTVFCEVVDGEARQTLDVAADAVEEVDAEAPLLIPAAQVERVDSSRHGTPDCIPDRQSVGWQPAGGDDFDRVARPAARVVGIRLAEPRSIAAA